MYNRATQDEVLEQSSTAATPGIWLVDIIPIWAEFKRIAKQRRNNVFALGDKPCAFVRHQINNGAYKPSYVSHLLEERSPETLTDEEETVVKWSAASLYAVKAVMRWHPVAPMGLPDTTTQDDVYEGYFILKGSMVLANIWGFTHDPTVYTDPMTFKPECFVEINSNTPELDPHTLSFGFGRRVCPGRLLADATIFLSVAQSFAVFNFSKGAEDIQPKFLPGVISRPAPYKLSITPRSLEHEKLIRSVEVEHPWEESDAASLERVVY